MFLVVVTALAVATLDTRLVAEKKTPMLAIEPFRRD